ncbi:hypothetical protein GWI33_009321 [Rhynchophorus ferrugineus]|uniref:Uncharacterized protein n=1 Tax=Rhynchophorus ferrugineus TaxID=354439 RepID=A0A834MFC2_RHYFE|nr:hypothetical protein GWI33_009321 [Rhynchophorus ferrugineus]
MTSRKMCFNNVPTDGIRSKSRKRTDATRAATELEGDGSDQRQSGIYQKEAETRIRHIVQHRTTAKAAPTDQVERNGEERHHTVQDV